MYQRLKVRKQMTHHIFNKFQEELTLKLMTNIDWYQILIASYLLAVTAQNQFLVHLLRSVRVNLGKSESW